MDKEIRVKGILNEIEGVRRNYHINYYIEDEFGWDDLYCILDYINNLQQERNNYKELYEKEKDLVDTILTFNLFGDECPLNFGFENGSPQEKAQKLFYEDDGEFCENNCDDCYKKCWLNFFNRIQELKCKK